MYSSHSSRNKSLLTDDVLFVDTCHLGALKWCMDYDFSSVYFLMRRKFAVMLVATTFMVHSTTTWSVKSVSHHHHHHITTITTITISPTSVHCHYHHITTCTNNTSIIIRIMSSSSLFWRTEFQYVSNNMLLTLIYDSKYSKCFQLFYLLLIS